jgi:hypothetical protein
MSDKSSADAQVARVLTETVITIAQARAAIAEATGQRPDKSTIHRWIKRGVGGIRLDAIRVGSATLTSAEAITRFITARTASI